MKRQIIFALLASTILSSCSKSGKVSPVRKDITQAVYASGKIYPMNDYRVVSKLPGYVEKIHVHIGDTVHAGQPLLTIKSEVSELSVTTAKNLLELARRNSDESSPMLNALKQDVASAKAKYELDSANATRFTNLYNQNASSKVQFDQAKTQFDISKQNYLKALSSYQSTRDRLRVELENAQIQYDAQLSNRNDYIIASVMNGKVYDIIPKEGELVTNQFMLMEIGDNKHYQAELSVDETDVSLIRSGQEIAYSIDAYKEHVFKGKVIECYPRITQSNKTSKVLASIELDASVNVFSGMSLEANIIISEKKQALVIPREFITSNNKVKLKSGGELVEIKKGIEDLQFVEILSGIDENTVIVKP